MTQHSPTITGDIQNYNPCVPSQLGKVHQMVHNWTPGIRDYNPRACCHLDKTHGTKLEDDYYAVNKPLLVAGISEDYVCGW